MEVFHDPFFTGFFAHQINYWEVHVTNSIAFSLNLNMSHDLYDELKLMIFGTPKSPEEIRKKLIELMNERPNILEKVILFIDPNTVEIDLLNGFLEYINNNYGNAKNRAMVRIYHLIPPIGVDTYIVENKHVIFNFSHPSGEKRYYRATLLENIPKVATDYSRWFSDVWSKSEPIEAEIDRLLKK